MAHVEQINGVSSAETLRRYLEDGLGYQTTDVTYVPGQLDIPPRPSEAIRSARLLSDYQKAFQTYLFETTSLTRTTIRSILEPFYRHHPAGDYLFIFTKDYSQLALVSPQRILRPGKPMPTLQLRILPVEPDNLYHTDLEVLNGISLTPADQKPEAIRAKHEEAFSVERVTDEFFETYKRILDQLKAILAAQRKGNADQVHAFAQQLFNRLMFLYFLQKKGWLRWGDGAPDKRYMRRLWREYGTARPSDASFYRLWLNSLFFQAFNKRSSLMPVDLPGDIRASFLNMPFLNGGLFVESDLDRLGFDVPDDLFTMLFDRNVDGTLPGFLERYNFTIQESLPLEVEVAVDPEMLGKVYESLINEEDRHQAGIFYTPRIEIDYMCRLSLIEYLHDVTGFSKDELIPFVMAPADERALADLGKDKLARLWSALEAVRLVDPAVGSGSFLVGMMNVLVQLYRAISEPLGRHQNEFALKKRIISENLYGVDVKDWAVRVCELRLWLSLVIESEETQMDIYGQPLLPNLTFKVRQGDSLLEEIAGVPLSLRGDYPTISPPLKQRIQHIVDRKHDYFRGDRSVTRHEIEHLEHDLLREVVDNKIKAIDGEIRKLEAPQEQAFQAGLEQIRGGLDITQAVLKQQEEARAKIQPQIDAKRAEKVQLQEVAASIGKKGDKDYFLWDIDFAEVFLEKDGFDVVIGNPPYVERQEVAPPLKQEEDYDSDTWREMKKVYKEQLERAIRAHWGSAVGKIDKKSDLYVYFYYQGLDLLRPGGVFCFINSNSWLDTDYGSCLQEFLLRNISVRQVIDNQVRRTFKASEVNPVIVLLRRPSESRELKDNQAKFVAYRQSFEGAVNAENLLLQEWADSVQSTQEFRVYSIGQRQLWVDGIEMPREGEAVSLELGIEHGRYLGGKWGGKYLAAPDVFLEVLRAHAAKLTPLRKLATVNEGKPTGANDFFYPTNAQVERFHIEPKYLRPAIMRARGDFAPELKPPDIERYFLCISDDRTRLRGTRALEYVKYGERLGLSERRTYQQKSDWYKFSAREPADLLVPCGVGDRHICLLNSAGALSSNSFTEIRFSDQSYCESTWAFLNSTWAWLLIELHGRRGLGGGMLKADPTDLRKLPIIKSEYYPTSARERFRPPSRPVRSVFEELGLPKANRDCSNISWEDVSFDKVLPDRRKLDIVVFEALGLTGEEQLAVYGAVVELVKNRLLKARSV